MAVHKKYPALGRGLDALISTKEVHTDGSSTINEIELDKISPNPNQPRRDFDPESLRELADSIAEIGIVQPITLRKMEDDTFQIIAGERRWRASKQADKGKQERCVVYMAQHRHATFHSEGIKCIGKRKGCYSDDNPRYIGRPDRAWRLQAEHGIVC